MDYKIDLSTIKEIGFTNDLININKSENRELFEEVLRRYPKIAEHIKKIADERVGQNIDIFKKSE